MLTFLSKKDRRYLASFVVVCLSFLVVVIGFPDRYRVLKITGYPEIDLTTHVVIDTSHDQQPTFWQPPKLLSQDEVRCMAQNLYHEARGEGTVGMAAVGYVVTNRAKSGLYPTNICDIIHQRLYIADTGKTVCQFSWVCQLSSYTPKNRALYAQAVKISKEVLREEIPNPIGESLFYHTDQAGPPLPTNRIALQIVIGNHEFYTLRGG